MCYTGKCKYEHKNCPNDYVGECRLGNKNIPEDAYCSIIEEQIEEYMRNTEKSCNDCFNNSSYMVLSGQYKQACSNCEPKEVGEVE